MLGHAADIFVGTEPIIAWRAWSVGGGQLLSPHQGDVWAGGKLEWAGQCQCSQALKGQDCHCGVNAYASEHELIEGAGNLLRIGTMVVGQVALEGEVRVFERGFRAERARVLRVWSLSADSRVIDDVSRLCTRDGVEFAGVHGTLRRARHTIDTYGMWHDRKKGKYQGLLDCAEKLAAAGPNDPELYEATKARVCQQLDLDRAHYAAEGTPEQYLAVLERCARMHENDQRRHASSAVYGAFMSEDSCAAYMLHERDIALGQRDGVLKKLADTKAKA